VPEDFTEEEKKILSQFFTNMDKPIFVLRNLPEVVKGALFSRYSRTDKSLRRVLLDEFILAPEMGFKDIVSFQTEKGADEIVAIKKAEEFYDRVLVGFGDDSVAELAGAHIAIEQVSNIATKVIEDARIGFSPLEKSSRYVYFNQKVNGQYQYYGDPVIMSSKLADLYIQTCDALFDTYSKLIDPMVKFLTEKFPQGDTPDRAYKFTIRAKACDSLRIFLPASTLTNMGLFGNGRAFEYLLTKMYAHPLQEMHAVAKSMHEELNKAIPSFVKRASPDDKYGGPTIQYMNDTRKSISEIAQSFTSNPVPSDSVSLVDFDPDAETKVLAGMMYSHTQLPLEQLRMLVRLLSAEERKQILNECLGRRQNRRHKTVRALENAYYTFDILGNYGIYRDLQRHRMLTQERQNLTVKHGYDMPKELVQAGFENEAREIMKAAADAFNQIYAIMPLQAQYAVPFGYKIRWYMKMNLREVFHFTELRSVQQGHPDYRKIAQKMFLKVKEIHPTLAEYIKFIDMNDYDLERLEAEKKLEKKLQEMNKSGP